MMRSLQSRRRSGTRSQTVNYTEKGTKYEEDDELNEHLDSLQENSVFLDADLLKDYKAPKKLTDRWVMIALTGLLVIGVIAGTCIYPSI